MLFLVGDNPFHGISHLSQERARAKDPKVTRPSYAADLVIEALRNGANGFMFSVSDTTLHILKRLSLVRNTEIYLCPIVPYAYEYVRYAVQGGIPALAWRFAKQVTASRNLKAVEHGIKGMVKGDLSNLMLSLVSYEISRMKSYSGSVLRFDSIFLHEVITDMALALGLDWLFRDYGKFLSRMGLTPGFETRNFSFLVDRFRGWDINLAEVQIAAPFNKVGFQMSPSKEACERALASIPGHNLIAFSVLAAGFLRPPQATEYLSGLPNLKGVSIGISTERHARESFKLFRGKLQHTPLSLER